ncbi:hypothetical protein M5X00_31900 [Paenibacillus alvei]|uniref:DUF6864 domain-containing function n=1 Tax=Paenibacillus alvei TaxID=44250 RepID=UPI000288BF2B|nr:hypothetical protein [Paenibacillus alvei]EJW14301.1 hypothetical protein PAV_15c00900 [Paenibacillus alvei DSM 29]MCY9539218.1 hypothetical protein [Paenibacillus alvei]MCY9706736.1 hypothetical protein [Paenibacillus alvei]MCY9737013.1 hypothetical protein [Paenibacillus alvei]MCY9758823.1 hypothetical protein [Paenibacillus alvei]
MEKITVTTESTEVISSGTLITYDNEPIKMSIDLNNWHLKLEFNFVQSENDNEDGNLRFRSNDNCLIIDFINFNNSLGMGNSTPIEIGQHRGKKLFLNYRVYSLTSNSDKTFHYTLYRNLKEGE